MECLIFRLNYRNFSSIDHTEKKRFLFEKQNEVQDRKYCSFASQSFNLLHFKVSSIYLLEVFLKTPS